MITIHRSSGLYEPTTTFRISGRNPPSHQTEAYWKPNEADRHFRVGGGDVPLPPANPTLD